MTIPVTTAEPKSSFSFEIQQKYRDNFAHPILSVTLYLQSEIMNLLTLKHGHSQLRINFEPYIAEADRLRRQFADFAGEFELQQVMAQIYASLQLDQNVFGHTDSDDIRVLARQLTRKLRDEGAKTLARLILSSGTDT